MPGVAKTTRRKTARAHRGHGLQPHPVYAGPDAQHVFGTSIFDPRTNAFAFKPGPIFSNIVLVDESTAPRQDAERALRSDGGAAGQVYGVTHPAGVPVPDRATQNPNEHEGTYRLPEAFRDRFLFKIDMGQILAGGGGTVAAARAGRSHRLEVGQVQAVITTGGTYTAART
ncbi:MAG: AAA family ATPase [Flavobacteriales bacterium]|nr:AAA family ATPase [Flavobacteriales bacterium]